MSSLRRAILMGVFLGRALMGRLGLDTIAGAKGAFIKFSSRTCPGGAQKGTKASSSPYKKYGRKVPNLSKIFRMRKATPQTLRIFEIFFWSIEWNLCKRQKKHSAGKPCEAATKATSNRGILEYGDHTRLKSRGVNERLPSGVDYPGLVFGDCLIRYSQS